MKEPSSALRPVLLLALAVLVLRVLLQGIAFPVELSGDEAHYWDWSRRPQLSYHTKGPAVPWLILVGRSLFGDTELGVRFFAYLSHAVASVAVGWMGAMVAGSSATDRRRVALAAAIGFHAVAAYQVAGTVMTIDAVMVCGWSLATAFAMAARQRAEQGQSITGPMACCGLALAFAVLAKYTAVLAALGIVIALWPERKRLRLAPGGRGAVLLGVACFALGLLPVVLWNAQNDWVTVRHLLWHLGEAEGRSTGWAWEPMWTVSYVALAFLVAGPFVAVAMIAGIGSVRRWKNPDHRLCFWSGVPVLAFYLAVSFKTETQGNWMVGAYAPLLVPAAHWITSGKTRTKTWLMRIVVVRGAATLAVVLFFLPLMSGVEEASAALGRRLRTPLRRVSGHRQFATEVRRLATTALGDKAPTTTIITDYYDKTAHLAFYLPEHPIVRCASKQLGNRPNAYDDFADTRLPDPSLAGQYVILVGGRADQWRQGLELEELRSIGEISRHKDRYPVLVAKLRSH